MRSVHDARLPAPVRVVAPTTIDAGPHAADAMLAAVEPGRVAVLCDPAVEHLLEAIGRGHPHHQLVCRPVDGAPTLDDVEAVGAWLASSSAAALLAVGGGRVLDLAKLAATAGSTAGGVRRLERLTRRAGYARLDADVTPGIPLLALPTTLGTGAEVSAVAVVDAGAGAGDRTLVFSPHLRPTSATLDPQATATLPSRLVREGALEALLRVGGAEIGSGSSLRIAGTEARLLTQQLAEVLEECRDAPADDELRLFLAQLSAATHRGWALTGRSAFPSPLWFLGTELSVVLGVTKLTATAVVLPAWLARVADGDERWGDAARLAGVRAAIGPEAPGVAVAQATRELLERWRLAPDGLVVAPDAARRTARRVVRRWGGRLPMLGRFDEAEIESLLAEALESAQRPVITAAGA